MIVDRYEPVNLFALIPKRYATFAPELQELDHLLDDDEIFQRVKGDLARRYPHSLTVGRFDSLLLRQFCRVYWEEVPDDTTLNRWANLIEPTTLA
jgi:IS5 family transposase